MSKFILICLMLLAPQLRAQEQSDWISYRDAYRQMIGFEKYGKPKQFLQNHFRLRPREKGAGLEEVRLTLNSKSLHLALPLDALGRAVFPFSKAAYDENAELNLNRSVGQFRYGAWISIVVRPDGVYAASDLRLACEQALAYLRDAGATRGKRCVGVQFCYPKNETAQVRAQAPNGVTTGLPASEGAAFPDDLAANFRLFAYSFAAYPEGGKVLTGGTPLAISALLE